MRWFIYSHKNLYTNKYYIGQTHQNPPEKRYKNGKGYANLPLFYKDIENYGWDSFEHKILKEVFTQEEADKWEQYYIKFFKSNVEGYNEQTGGKHFNHTNEFKENIRKAQKHNWQDEKYRNKMLGIFSSKEYKNKLSKASKKQWARTYESRVGQNHWNYGHKLKEETKQKIKLSQIGEKNNNYGGKSIKPNTIEKMRNNNKNNKKVKCVDDGLIFRSASEAARFYGADGSSLTKVCRGELKSTKHKHFVYVNREE